MTDKESLTHAIEDDLDRRNRNWNKVDRNTDDIDKIKGRYIWFADYEECLN
ncbi:MAG TPA: hypothetical protein GXZ90_06105 [Clostridiales bacterium]|nr:hypothetical protein [Clostridiales bacterium]